MKSFINWSMTMTLFNLLLLAMLYLKKILFFEDITPIIKKKVKRMVIAQIILSFVLAAASIIESPIVKKISEIIIVILVLNIYFIIFYSSYNSRKNRKWFAFIIPFPLAAFAISIYNLSQAVSVTVAQMFSMKKNTFFLPCFFACFVLLIQILRKVKGSLIWKIEKYSEGKSISEREERMICLVAFFLAMTIGVNSLYDFKENTLAQGLLWIYGFLFAMMVIYTIYTNNGRHYFANENQKLQRVLITTMADLVENRDENTGGHIKRTAAYVEIIARELQKEEKFTGILTDEYIEDLIIAAPLHDIGKIHIPDSILDKPGKLTEEEFEIMKTHTTAGYNVIKRVEKQSKDIPYIQIAKKVALYHHEWMNGKGYPQGLYKEEIPLCARIMAVADVFDALVSKRCYKEPMPLEKAYDIMREESGEHFDPDVIEAFFAAKESIEEVMRSDED